MSHPIRIIITPTGAHLASWNTESAWCGQDVRGRPGVELEPGSEYGLLKDDCRRCLATWRGKWAAEGRHAD